MTNREAHEQAAGIGLKESFFRFNERSAASTITRQRSRYLGTRYHRHAPAQ